MVVRSAALWAMTLGAISVAAPISGAHALTMKECSAKYKAAQDSGALEGMRWTDFRKAECGTGASALPSTAPATGANAGRYEHRRTTCGDRPYPSIRRRFSVGSRAEIFDRIRRQGPDAHLPRSIQCEQDRRRQRQLEMDPEGWRLLQ